MTTAPAVLALVAVALWWPATGHAQDRTSQVGTAKKIGDYGGVVPGKSTLKGRKRPNRLSWVGFQPREGGASRIFVQLSSETTYSQTVRGKVLVVKVDGARYRNRNARRRLDMRFFNSSLRMVTSKRVSKRRARKGKPARTAGIELRIQFKDDSDVREAQATLQREQDGYYYLYLDFGSPAGSGSIRVSDDQDDDDSE